MINDRNVSTYKLRNGQNKNVFVLKISFSVFSVFGVQPQAGRQGSLWVWSAISIGDLGSFVTVCEGRRDGEDDVVVVFQFSGWRLRRKGTGVASAVARVRRHPRTPRPPRSFSHSSNQLRDPVCINVTGIARRRRLNSTPGFGKAKPRIIVNRETEARFSRLVLRQCHSCIRNCQYLCRNYNKI